MTHQYFSSVADYVLKNGDFRIQNSRFPMTAAIGKNSHKLRQPLLDQTQALVKLFIILYHLSVLSSEAL
jgi:hypothetical protein